MTNHGPEGVTGATVSDAFPVGLTGVSWSCAGTAGGACTGSGTSDVNDLVDLPAGATVTYSATGVVDSAAVGTLSNTATVTVPGGVIDPSPGNDSATDSDALEPEADLAVALAAAPAEVEVGSPVTCTVDVTNAGPSVASGVVVTLELPAGAAFTSASGSGWSCAGAGSTVTCSRAELAVGPAPTLSVQVLAPGASGPATATVTVAAAVADPDPSNNGAPIIITVISDTLATVVAVSSVADSGDGALAAGETVHAALTQILVRFGVEMLDPSGDGSAVDVSNPQSYLLVAAGADRVFATVGCVTGVGPGDGPIAVSSVTYDAGSGIAALRVNGGIPLDRDRYRLLACSAGLASLDGMPFDGDGNGTGGDDFVFDFSVAATNLLENPNFDRDLEGWSLSSATEIDHDPLADATAASSGSAAFISHSGSGTNLSISQCLEVTSFTGLLVGGRVRVSSAFAQDPLLAVVVESYDESGCAGTLLERAIPGGLAGNNATWRSFQGPAMVPDETISLRIIFDFEAGDASSFDAWLDELYLFETIFSDGFESGDTSRWSASMP